MKQWLIFFLKNETMIDFFLMNETMNNLKKKNEWNYD